MEYVEYGKKDGKMVIYFHGAPGAMEECAIFDRYAKEHNLTIVCFDRFSMDCSLHRESYYNELAAKIRIKSRGEPIDFIGFSIGAHVALEVSALLRSQVKHIHLVSAAAPLSDGDFIDHMAGGLVFKLAAKKPFLFFLLTQYQKVMALVAPGMLVNILFASAAGKDKELSKQSDFKRYMTPILRHCFQKRVRGYIRDVKLYTAWLGAFSRNTSIVHLWHGTEDNWSPFSMASYLCNAIPGATHVEAMEGLSHYSCLFEAASKICIQLEKP
ncbi:alpha/beta hydrolase [bacterium]|nr:alpha/beta hydrolase [bacterium]